MILNKLTNKFNTEVDVNGFGSYDTNTEHYTLSIQGKEVNFVTIDGDTNNMYVTISIMDEDENDITIQFESTLTKCINFVTKNINSDIWKFKSIAKRNNNVSINYN